MRDIIPNGTLVKTKVGDIKAYVIAVCVRGKDNGWIEYQVSYFQNGQLERKWLEDFEIEIIKENSKPIGFARTSNQNLIS